MDAGCSKEPYLMCYCNAGKLGNYNKCKKGSSNSVDIVEGMDDILDLTNSLDMLVEKYDFLGIDEIQTSFEIFSNCEINSMNIS